MSCQSEKKGSLPQQFVFYHMCFLIFFLKQIFHKSQSVTKKIGFLSSIKT